MQQFKLPAHPPEGLEYSPMTGFLTKSAGNLFQNSLLHLVQLFSAWRITFQSTQALSHFSRQP